MNMKLSTHRLNKYRNVIENFDKFPINIKKLMIKKGPSEFVDIICEICFNVLNLNVPLNSDQKKSLCCYKKLIKVLCCKKISKKIKRKKLVQKGGSFLCLLFSAAAPVIAQLISKNI